MANHYFTNQPEVAHERKNWDFELRGKQFSFVTDSNVFSRETVDFGSRVLIEAFDDEQLPEGPILDVGCGYGPIGLALAHGTERFVEMTDVNERAIELAKENADKNGVKHVLVYPSYIYESIPNNEFAAVVSNPPIRAGKKVVHEIISGAYDKLLVGGTLTIVIQKKQGAESAKKKMAEVFGHASVIKKEKGYYVIVSEKE